MKTKKMTKMKAAPKPLMKKMDKLEGSKKDMKSDKAMMRASSFASHIGAVSKK